MFLKGAVASRAKGRKAALYAAATAAILSVPAMMYSFGANPPLGYTGAPGQGTCASCHGTLTTGSGVTVNAPASYTPGGAAVSMTVTIPSTGGYELAVLTQSGNAQAGTLTAGTGSSVSTVGTLEYVYSSAEQTSWTFNWTPPATSVGTLMVYVTGGGRSANYSNTAMITAGSSGPPAMPTLDVNGSTTPTGLTFTAQVGGTASPQNVSVTASDNTAKAFSALAASTPAGWLSVGSASGTTPDNTEAISVSVGSLAAGTYHGSVTFSSTATSNASVTLPVTLNVTSTTPPPTGTFSLTVVDRQSGGADYLLLDGSGDATNPGSGNFTRFRSGTRSSGGTRTTVVSNGTWKATSVTSSAAGKLVLQVQLMAATSGSSAAAFAGSLTITDSSSSSGSCSSATLAATFPGSTTPTTFSSANIGSAKLSNPGTSCGGGGGTGGGGTPDE